MLNPEELSNEVLSVLQHRFDIPDTHMDKLFAQIREMSPDEAFTAFLEWHGIIGYSDLILRAWRNIEAATVKSPVFGIDLATLDEAEERDRQRRIEARIESSQRRDENPGDSRNPDWTEE